MRPLKSLLGRMLYATGMHGRIARDRAFVVLFHRVDDRYAGDPISCTSHEFERYCRFFREHFNVVSLTTLLDRLDSGSPVGGDLVITFDDGYLDNATVAAPILRRLDLPACFFIATELIGSDRVPWWDAEASIESEWMSWDHVRALVADGFEVGSHTMNHVDLGVVRGHHARVEIEDSKTRLEAETGTSVPLFSYPYGRRHQMTDENRDLVRAAGYRCCLSAYGGTVDSGSDPYDIKRMAVTPWHVSPAHFGFEALSEKP